MNLTQYSRRRYTEGKTPIEFLPRLSETVGGPNLYVKRDDLLGLAGGGNKTRKLEFLVAEAVAQGADTLITCGGIQSNHCRLTLAAAVKEGLQCRLVLSERIPGSYQTNGNGNVFLYQLLGAEAVKVVPAGTDMLAEMEGVAAELRGSGRKPYIIPMGGSNHVGALGYAACAEEIMDQCFQQGLTIDHILLSVGSGGTMAGLLAGLYGNRWEVPVTGISVLNPRSKAEDTVWNLVEQTFAYLKHPPALKREQVVCLDDYLGEGYTIPTPEMLEAVKMTARTEGILLDTTYTGKGMSGVIGLARKGVLKKGDNVLFLHTGGAPGLYANTHLFGF